MYPSSVAEELINVITVYCENTKPPHNADEFPNLEVSLHWSQLVPDKIVYVYMSYAVMFTACVVFWMTCT